MIPERDEPQAWANRNEANRIRRVFLTLIFFLSQSNSRMNNFHWVVIFSPTHYASCTSCESTEIGSCAGAHDPCQPWQLFHYNRRSRRLMIAICPKVLNAIARSPTDLYGKISISRAEIYICTRKSPYTCSKTKLTSDTYERACFRGSWDFITNYRGRLTLQSVSIRNLSSCERIRSLKSLYEITFKSFIE